MNMSSKLLFVIILLAGGNSWATGNLSSGFHTPQNSSLVVTIWITPSFVGQTPEVCKTVKILPLKGKRERFSTLAAMVELCLLHVPGQQSFNLFQRIGRRDVLQYMM